MYNKKYVIMVAVAILASVVAAMAYANSDGWKNRKQRDTVEIIADSSSYVVSSSSLNESSLNESSLNESSLNENSESSKIESSSKIDSSSNANSSEIESSSLNENSLSESSESDNSSEICNSENVQNNVEIPSDNVTYEVWENEKSVGEPVQGKTYEPVEESEKSVGDAVVGCYEPSEYEKVMLANLTAREYGSDWVSTYDKAKVVATVMNRVNADEFPDTVYDVVTQPGQFDGYLPSDSYTYQVTDDCIAAVDYYFDHPDEFGDYKYFYGTGYENIFY